MNNEFPISVPRLLIFVAISIASYGAYADTSPFANQPLQLIDRTVTRQTNNAKPNVMLFLDDSFSMSDPVYRYQECIRGTPSWIGGCRNYQEGNAEGLEPGTYVGIPVGRKIDILKKALTGKINIDEGSEAPGGLIGAYSEKDTKDKYTSKLNWAMTSLRGNELDYTNDANLVQEKILSLAPSGQTPATIQYIEAAKKAQGAIKFQCQQNFIVMLSDGDANRGGPKAGDSISDLGPSGLFDNLPSGYKPYLPGKSNGIAYFSHKLLNTDLKKEGMDKEGNPWSGKQNIETYTVGFSSGNGITGLTSKGKAYLEDAGAARSQSFYFAESPEELVSAFKKIFQDIASRSTPVDIATTSIATPSNTSSSIANMAATMTLNTGNWSSEIKFHTLENGAPAKKADGTYDSTSADYSGRQIIVSNGSSVTELHGFPEQAAEFGFSNSNEFQNAFVPWLARSKSDSDIKKAIKDATGSDESYRDTINMGDVLNASVLGIGSFEEEVDEKTNKAVNKYKSSKYVVTGANDGMVYIFENTGRSSTPYRLALNYLPGSMQREGEDDTLAKNLKNLVKKNYGTTENPHMYGVNGGIAYTITPDTAGRRQRTLALGAMGQGGRGVYALNIAGCERDKKEAGECRKVGMEAGNWVNSVPAWESGRLGGENLLGYTVGSPTLYQGATGTWSKNADGKTVPTITNKVKLLGFVANGYPSLTASMANLHDQVPTLYIYDALGEELGTTASPTNSTKGFLKKIPVSGAEAPINAKGAGVLSSPTVVDIDADGIADIVYAGDYAGDLYRFDLRGTLSEWKVAKLYDGINTQPITAAPAVYRVNDHKVVVLFGTGSDLFEEDLANQDQQAFYGIHDDLSNDVSTVGFSSVATRTLTETTAGALKKKAEAVNSSGTAAPAPSSPKDAVAVRTVAAAQKENWKINLAPGVVFDASDKSKKTKSSEKVVVQPSVLLSTVFFSTRIYNFTAEELKNDKNFTDNGSVCGVVTTTEKSSGNSWLMALDAETGGMPKAVRFSGDIAEGTAGYELGALSSQATVLSTSNLTSDVPPSALNDNSQVGNGELVSLGKEGATVPMPKKLNNKCLNSNDYFVLLTKDQREDALVNFGLTGKVCPGPGLLIRLNTHEIIQ